MKFTDFLRRPLEWPSRRHAEPSALYRYRREVDGAVASFHLRIDPAGDGLLLANASSVARLTASGVLIAKGLLEGVEPSEIVRHLKRQFRGANEATLTNDVAAVRQLIAQMERPSHGYPLLNLADPAFSPKAAPLGRPISADVPLCAPFHAARLLERLWQLGIPHVTFSVGSNPSAEHLVRAVEKAGDLGMITGLRGRGSDFAQANCLIDLAAAGLDHLDLLSLSTDDAIHDALAGKGDSQALMRMFRSARKSELCVVAQLVLVRPTLPTLAQSIEKIARHGTENVALFAIGTTDPAEAELGAMLADEIVPIARQLIETAERCKVRLMVYPTVQFDRQHSLADQICAGPRTSGDTSIRVEPDGTVFAPRGPYRSAGNLFDDAWETIHHSEAFAAYRRRLESDTHCEQCPGLAICAADCPRDPAGWAMPASTNL